MESGIEAAGVRRAVKVPALTEHMFQCRKQDTQVISDTGTCKRVQKGHVESQLYCPLLILAEAAKETSQKELQFWYNWHESAEMNRGIVCPHHIYSVSEHGLHSHAAALCSALLCSVPISSATGWGQLCCQPGVCHASSLAVHTAPPVEPVHWEMLSQQGMVVLFSVHFVF
jgi:hypothetical protein